MPTMGAASKEPTRAQPIAKRGDARVVSKARTLETGLKSYLQ
jgi:hypothetical protein